MGMYQENEIILLKELAQDRKAYGRRGDRSAHGILRKLDVLQNAAEHLTKLKELNTDLAYQCSTYFEQREEELSQGSPLWGPQIIPHFQPRTEPIKENSSKERYGHFFAKFFRRRKRI